MIKGIIISGQTALTDLNVTLIHSQIQAQN